LCKNLTTIKKWRVKFFDVEIFFFKKIETFFILNFFKFFEQNSVKFLHFKNVDFFKFIPNFPVQPRQITISKSLSPQLTHKLPSPLNSHPQKPETPYNKELLSNAHQLHKRQSKRHKINLRRQKTRIEIRLRGHKSLIGSDQTLFIKKD
jgi:hypothetical protein